MMKVLSLVKEPGVSYTVVFYILIHSSRLNVEIRPICSVVSLISVLGRINRNSLTQAILK